MSDKVFNDIMAGLQEALEITKGTADPETFQVYDTNLGRYLTTDEKALWRAAKGQRKQRPDPEAVDDENPEWTDEMFAQARPAREVMGDAFVDAWEAARRARARANGEE